MRCLLAEDDEQLAEWLVKALLTQGVLADWEERGLLAVNRVLHDDYDALLLDLGLPDIDGSEVLRRIRAAGSTLPVIILTARDDLAERVSLLHIGADDFMMKPFAVAELEARLSALLRRRAGHAQGIFRCGSLTYHQHGQRFELAGAPLHLSPREHALLRLLIQRAGDPLSKAQILSRLVGDDKDLNPEAVEVMVYRLRRKLQASDTSIQTIRGLGYVLEAANG
ncbi:two component transcriptional regulator [Ketogulonicigenium robustum]|uniref:Two component transcriptional regulator n=1 Tax=Ketogulonicigenium robustum TaxID=92947 RepID=A0A1W6P0M2_9RHOB|nr:response regulator [Ketogulonicigenium robustum]ARO14880.1 two component transcriptional regulator [Ketogulonicigenium robustum]